MREQATQTFKKGNSEKRERIAWAKTLTYTRRVGIFRAGVAGAGSKKVEGRVRSLLVQARNDSSLN